MMSSMKKILITVGGTGGHIYPAIALCNQIRQRNEKVDFLFVGGRLQNNPYFTQQEYAFESIDCATFSLRNPLKIPSSCLAITKGVFQSRKILSQYRPHLALGFGSFYSLPALIAARSMKVPIILHEGNFKAGRVNRLIAPLAQMSAIHFPGTAMKGRTVYASMPLRYNKGSANREEAFNYFGLKEGLPVLLIFGGSQGARFFNRQIKSNVPYQVIHLTGEEVDQLQAQYDRNGVRAIVKKFESHMHFALEIADAAVCRSGASTVGELIEYEIPGLMVPLPIATDDHQYHNARFMADAVGGGVVVRQNEATQGVLEKKLELILVDRQRFKRNIQHYKKLNQPQDICSLIMEKLEEYE